MLDGFLTPFANNVLIGVMQNAYSLSWFWSRGPISFYSLHERGD
jgi:hypothetical protein